jgi:hypothetical protein
VTFSRDHYITIEQQQKALIGPPPIRPAEMRDPLDTKIASHHLLLVRPIASRTQTARDADVK